MASPRKNPTSGRRKRAVARREKDIWDPATPAPDGGRRFHATHFTADPRGAGMAGAPPTRVQTTSTRGKRRER